MELFKLFGEVVVNVKDAVNALDETTDKAEETAESVGEVGKESKQAGKTTTDSLLPIPPKFLKVATAAGAVVTAVIAIGKAMIELANDTRDYRVEMAKLEAAFTDSGHTGETATEVYRELHAVLGETDQAVEAANHLAKLCSTEEELRALTNACVGVYASFGDSLPIEGLAEAANETAKTGSLTGQLADALKWAGQSEAEFQEKLNACNTEKEMATLIAETLAEVYGEVGETYKETNKDILDSVKAQEELNAAQARWGEAFEPLAAAWYSFLASVLNFSADALENAIDPMQAMTDVLAGTQETAAEASEKVASLKAELEGMNSIPAWLWTPEMQTQKVALEAAIRQATDRYNELTEAEQQAAIEAQNASDPAVVDAFTVATEQYISDASALLTKFEETYSQTFDKVVGWFSPFEKVQVSVTTSIGEMIKGMQSQIDFNNQYSANLQYLKEQGLGGLADAFQAYGAEGSAYAKTVADALKKAGGAATEEGQKIIADFKAISDAQLQSQEELANTLALANGEIETEMQSLADNYAEKIAELDMSTEALTNAQNTMSGFLEGITNGVPGIISKMSELGTQMTKALQQSLGVVHINVQADMNDIPGYETGLDYVPYDNYLAYLHKGEAVLTAEEATAWRAGKEVASSGNENQAGGSMVINQYIESVAQSPVELAAATEAYFVQARWAMA